MSPIKVLALCVCCFIATITQAQTNQNPSAAFYFPPYVLSPKEVAKLYNSALKGDTSSSLALVAHYSFMDPTGKKSEYWRYVGAWYGSSESLVSYLNSGVPITRDQAIQKLVFARWVWAQFSANWTNIERQRVKKSYLNLIEFKELQHIPLEVS